MGLQFRRFSRRKSDASPARKYSNGSQHDSSASQDSSSSSSLPESTEVGNIVRSCIQQLVKSQQPLNEGHQEGLDALKSLFALSSPEDSRRRDVICVAGGALLPVLFSYIDRADECRTIQQSIVFPALFGLRQRTRHGNEGRPP